MESSLFGNPESEESGFHKAGKSQLLLCPGPRGPGELVLGRSVCSRPELLGSAKNEQHSLDPEAQTSPHSILKLS